MYNARGSPCHFYRIELVSDSPERITTCQGCGGRNLPGSTECDWCGRPFISKGGRLRITVWQVISTLFLLALIGAVAALAFLNAGRTLPSVRASVTSSCSSWWRPSS